MQRSFFQQVKEALAADAESTLRELGVNLKKSVKGTWTQCVCPLCDDQSGSASITREGFLRCHQCGRKMDVCEWYAETKGVSAWEACKAIGAVLRLDMKPGRKQGRMPRHMTHEILRTAVHNLWELEEAEPIRKFLKARGLTDQLMLERFGVGFIAGSMVIAQWTPAGILRSCFRVYTPGQKPPWGWKGGTRGGTLGFWPHFQLPDDGVVWVMEGEWDVLVAWCILKLQNQGIYAVTWTGGAGSPIKPFAIPEPWRGREVHLVPDNDTFQGNVVEEFRAPDEKKKQEMLRRWKVLVEDVAPSFLAQNCKVFLRAIPLDPLKIWGGDFRDWVERGGRDLTELHPYEFKSQDAKKKKPVEADFSKIFTLAGKVVKFTAKVCAINQDGISIPKTIELQCDMNSMPYCQLCKAPSRIPEGVIHRADFEDEIAKAMMSRDPNAYMMRHIVGKPPTCVHAALNPLEYDPGCKWLAIDDNMEEASDRQLPVISEDPPSLSGEIEIVGMAHHANSSIMIMADQLRQLDCAEIDLNPHTNDLLQACPWDTDSPEAIEEYLQKRAQDYASNVTKIYGRPELHIAHDLLAHSVLYMEVDGLRNRGWLDIAILGDTATGKSMTFHRLVEHHRLGTWQNCGRNISRAGLTLGAVATRDGYRLSPGLFPRSHRKMLILDEFQNVMQADILKDLQGARDDGFVYSAKVTGSRQMPAATRLAVIGNWPTDRNKFRFLCEHFQAAYKTPEALRRTDFGLVVVGPPSDNDILEVEHIWTPEMVQATILRAWAMDENMVHISPKAVEYAKQRVKDWIGFYDHELPLFTPEEKHLSILRIACAVANICFSHPPGEPYQLRVTRAHAVWAAQWLERTFLWSQYKGYSLQKAEQAVLRNPFEAEKELTVSLNLVQPEDACALLPQFFRGMTQSEIMGTIGMDHRDSMRWIHTMVRLNALNHTRNALNTNQTEIRLTKAGDDLVRKLLVLAEEFPEGWRTRQAQLGTPGPLLDRSTLMSMTESLEDLRREWEERYG